MTRHPSSAPRYSGDAWVEGPDGVRFWGRYGAAGLLAHDPRKGVLLQHRVAWSHFGGTWGLPGGALHDDETPYDGALREAQEEAGVPDGAVVPRAAHVFDAGVWQYTTVIAGVADPFEPVISDPESLELRWVAVDEVGEMPLHPGFAAAWPQLRDALPRWPIVLVDAANVVGSVPDGWWKDRAGANARLRDRLEIMSAAGVDAADVGLPLDRWFPIWAMVVEGEAKGIDDGDGSVLVFRAAGSGDDDLVARADAMARSGHEVIAVTSDRALRERLEAVGAEVRGASWLRDLLPPDGAGSGVIDAAAENGAWALTGLSGLLRGLFS